MSCPAKWLGKLPGTVLSSVTEPFNQAGLGQGYVSFPMTSVPLFFKKEFSVLSHWSPMEHVSCMCPVGTAGTHPPTPHKHGFTSQAQARFLHPWIFMLWPCVFSPLCVCCCCLSHTGSDQNTNKRPMDTESQGAFKLLSRPRSNRGCL